MRAAVIILIVAAVALIGGLSWHAYSRYGAGSFSGAPRMETYENTLHGFAFSYPATYAISEAERGDGHRGHYSIVLTRKGDVVPAESDGPESITIDVYQNDLDRLTLPQWLETSQSNYKLGDGMVSSTTVAGEEAVAYRWSGLYEGDTTAFISGNDIIAVSVMHIAPEEQIVTDYRRLLGSVSFSR